MNNKGQVNPLLVFGLMALIIFLLFPVLLKMFNGFRVGMNDQLGNLSAQGQYGTSEAQQANEKMLGGVVNTWDTAAVFLFFGIILLVLISSFFVDTSPIWIGIFGLSTLFVVIFIPQVTSSLDTLYNGNLALEGSQLSMLNNIREHFGTILVAVMIVVMVIIFGKPYIMKGGSSI